VTAVILWGAFPTAYSILLSAFYLPLLVMLAGLILRGVAFEYRNKTERMRWVWDWSFIVGSFAASFIQGLTVRRAGRRAADCQRAICWRGFRLVQSQHSPPSAVAWGAVSWLTHFSVPVGLVKKCEGELREQAYRLLPYLAIGLLVFLVTVFAMRSPKIFK